MRKLIIVAGLLLLVGLLLVLRPDQGDGEPAADSGQAVRQKAFDIVISDGKMVGGSKRLQVVQGETITIRVASDRFVELHLHGYELSFRPEPGKPAVRTFTADRSGRFEAESHETGAVIFALEVQP